MRNNNLTIIILFLLLSFLLIEPVSAQFERRAFPPTSTLQKIQSETAQRVQSFDDAGMDSFILAIMDEYHIAGGAYCVLKDGEIVWKLNAGYANIEENRLVTDSTSFNTGSVSKTFTATALMQLWEEGLFRLDDDINDYLPEDLQVHHYYYPDDSITFKMLLTHTSGIRDDWNLLLSESMVFNGDSPISIEEFLKNYLVPGGAYYNKSHFYQYSEPGADFNYTDVGFTLIAYLVEVISEMPFNQYCQENIFEPMEMNHTAWFLSDLNMDNIAVPYKWDGNSYSAYEFMGTPYYPAAFFRISARELAVFLKEYMQKEETLLDITTIDMMVEDYLGLGERIEHQFLMRGWGLCWYEQFWDGYWLWGHMGRWYGARAGMFYDKENNYGFIDLINTGWNDDISFEGWRIIGNQLAHFASSWGHVYAVSLETDDVFIHKNKDLLWITTRFVNRDQHPFNAQLIYTSTDSTVIDSVPLCDDGAHQDGDAEDGIFGCKVGPMQEEKEFLISVLTHDLTNDTHFKADNLARFTSIGPIVLDHIEFARDTVANPGDNLFLSVYLRNEGQSAPVNISATMSCADTFAEVRSSYAQADFGDIGPGEVSGSKRYFVVQVGDGPFPQSPYELNLSLDIQTHEETQVGNVTYHDYYSYWQDSLSIAVGIDNEDALKPAHFTLSQNYPNPFNPTTTIRYSVGAYCNTPQQPQRIDLSVYNLLGQKVVTLVSEKQPAGHYEVEWDASGFASGVYYYKLTTDQKFAQTRKLVLLR